MPKVTTDEAEELLDEGATYVDVRTVEEFADGHVPGAINVPLNLSGPGGMVPNSDFMAVMEASFAKDQILVIGCKSGGRSAKAVNLLEAAGFEKLHDMTAGFIGSKDAFGQAVPGWQAEGREVEMDAEEDQTYEGIKKLDRDSGADV